MPVPTPLKTVLVLGAAYAGNRVVEILSKSLPLNWRIVVIDRSTHFCHIYAFPRVSILPGHEQKVFIPNTTLFTRGLDADQRVAASRHELIHGTVRSLGEDRVSYIPFVPRNSTTTGSESPATRIDDTESRASSDADLDLVEGEERVIPFDYCIYSLGAKYPSPINVWTHQPSIISHEPPSIVHHLTDHEVHEINPTPRESRVGGGLGVVEVTECRGTKKEGMAWMKAAQERIKEMDKILIVGGGALGVQMATDIVATHGKTKTVTLLHSRPHLLNRFDEFLHTHALSRMQEMGIDVILGARVESQFINKVERGLVRTMDGREIEADLILWCTGQSPNTSYIQQTYPSAINPSNSLAYINRHLQLSTLKPTVAYPTNQDGPNDLKNDDFEILNPRIFVMGDCADAFGALNAGHTAYYQGQMAAENVLELIKVEEENRGIAETEEKKQAVLQEYQPPNYGIKVSLGRDFGVYQVRGKLGTADPADCADDLHTGVMWTCREMSDDNMYL